MCQSYPTATLNALNAQTQGLPLFHGFSEAERPELLKHLYAIPKVYRDQILDTSRTGEFKGFFKENIGSSGVCYGGSRFCTKIAFSASQRGVIGFSFIHEAGHGLVQTVAKNAGLSRSQLLSKYEDFMEEGRAHNNSAAGRTSALRIRSYSFSGVNEFWADSFHNYYCSPEANDFIKKYLPRNYEFLVNNLPKPSWIEGGDDEVPAAERKHIGDLVSLYNGTSKTCDFDVASVEKPAADGSFKASLKLKGSDKTLALDSNVKANLSSELFRLRRGMPDLIAACPAE